MGINRYRKVCIDCEQEFAGPAYRGRCHACFKKVVTADGGLPAVGVSKTRARDRDKYGRKPSEPTRFEPGSDGKKEIMRLRAGRGESCFHPDDANGGESDDRRHFPEEYDDDGD